MSAALGLSTPSPRMSASCQEESSSVTGLSGAVSPRNSRGEIVMFPPRRDCIPDAMNPWWIALTVEDLPLEPVTATRGDLE